MEYGSVKTVALSGSKRDYESDDSFRHRLKAGSYAQLVWLLGQLGVIDKDLAWRCQQVIVEKYAIHEMNQSYKSSWSDLVK